MKASIKTATRFGFTAAMAATLFFANAVPAKAQDEKQAKFPLEKEKIEAMKVEAQNAKTPTPTPGESKYKSTIKSAIPSSQDGTNVRGASPSPSPIRTATPSSSASPKKEIIRQDRAKHTPTPTPTSHRP